MIRILLFLHILYVIVFIWLILPSLKESTTAFGFLGIGTELSESALTIFDTLEYRNPIV